MREELSDEQLMEHYRDGDAGAFDVLYHRHKGGVFRYLFRLAQNQSIAEELFQDVWSNLIRSRERYQVTAKFTTFLYQIAHHRFIDYVRKKPELTVSMQLDDDDDPLDPIPANEHEQPEAMVERKRLVENLVKTIEGLPALQREAFLLREEAGFSVEEIAQATGVNAETAKSRLRYAMSRLREGLRGLR